MKTKTKTTIELSPEQIKQIICKALNRPEEETVLRFNIGEKYSHPMDRHTTPVIKSAIVTFETDVELQS